MQRDAGWLVIGEAEAAHPFPDAVLLDELGLFADFGDNDTKVLFKAKDLTHGPTLGRYGSEGWGFDSLRTRLS